MLAITGMPAADGDLLTASIVLAANTADPANILTITLDDTNILQPGKVVATISDGTVTRNVWNFSGITFTGTFDTAGDVVNSVTISSRYGFDLESDPASTSNFYAWRADADFTPGTLADVGIDMENVDVLSLSSPLGRTSIEGLFEVPTIIPAVPRGQISVASNEGIEVGAAGVEVYDLTLDNNHAGKASAITFGGPVVARNNLTIRDSNSITVSQPLTAGLDLDIATIKSGGGAGDIFVTAAIKAQAGDVTLSAVADIEATAPVESVLGGIKLGADDELLVDAKLKAQGSLALVGGTKITLEAAADLLADTGAVSLTSLNGGMTTDGVIATLSTGGVTLKASTDITSNTVITSAAGDIVLDSANGNVVSTKALLAKAGDINLTSAAGHVTSQADIEATAGAVTIDAKRYVDVTSLRAFADVNIDAGTDVTLNKAVAVTGAPLGTGLVKIAADAGNILQKILAPITVVDGKIELQSVAGTVSLNSLVQANLAIDINASQGIVIDNSEDKTAAVRASGVDGNISIKSDANGIVIDAPVSSLAAAIEVLAVNGLVDVRDDMDALLDLSITAKTTVTAHSVPDLVKLTTQTGTLTLESTAGNVVIAPDVTLVAGPGAEAGISLLAATTVAAPIVLQAEGDITIVSPDSYVVTKSITSNLGSIAITAASGPLTSILQPLSAGETISLEAAGPLTLDNQLKTTTGGIDLKSTGSSVSIAATAAIIAPDSAGGSLSIDAGTALALGIPLLVGNDITIVTGGTFIPATDITTTNGSISITSTSGDLDVAGIALSAVGGTPPNYGSGFLSAAAGKLTVDLTQVLLNPIFGDLTLIGGTLVGFGGGPYTIGGSLTVQTGSAVVPAAGEDLESLNGSIDIRSTGGSVDVTNIDVKALLGSIMLKSDSANVIVGTRPFVVSPTIHGLASPPWVAAPGEISLAAGGAVTVGQPLVAGGTITITSTETYRVEHNLVSDFADVVVTSTAGDILIDNTAGKASLIAADVATGTITLSANGAIDNATSPGTAIGTKLFAKAMVAEALGPSGFRFTNPENDVETLDLTLPNGTDVTFTDVDSLTLSGAMTVTKGNVNLTTLTGPLSVAADISVASGDVDFESKAGSLDVSGAISVDTGDVTAVAASDLKLGDVTVNAGSVVATAAAGVLSVTGGIDVTVGDVTLTSTTSSLDVSGAISVDTGDVTAVAASHLKLGDVTINAGSVVATAAAGVLSVTGGIDVTSGDVTLTSTTSSLDVSGAISVDTGDVTAVAASHLKLGDVTINAGSVVATAAAGVLSVTGGIDVTSGDVTLVSTTGGLAVTGGIKLATAGSTGVTLTAATSLDIGSVKVGAGDVAATATAGDLTAAGSITVTTGEVLFTVPAGDIVVTGAITATASDINLAAGAGIQIGGDIKAGRAVSLTAGATSSVLTNGIELTGAEILAGTGDINIRQVGSVVDDGVLIHGDMTAGLGSIYVKTDANIDFTGGTITAAPVYAAGPPAVGLVRFEAALGIAMTAGRQPVPGGFDISFAFAIDVPQSVIDASATAALRWEEIIVGDLVDVIDPDTGETIDDVLIAVQMGLLGGDPGGPGDTLANATPLAFRDNGAGLPYLGAVGVDTFDADNAALVDIMIHEFAHVLGFPGVQAFQDFLLGDFFTGSNAVREYESIFGANADPAGVPMETGGGPGTRRAHWSEDEFGNELLTGFIGGGENPLSRVTVGAFEDMGYTVDYAAADPFTPPAVGLPGGTPLAPIPDLSSGYTRPTIAVGVGSRLRSDAAAASGPPHIIAGRLEIISANGGGTDLELSGDVSTLMVIAPDSDLQFTNGIPLTLTDFDNATPSIQIDAFDVTITSPMGLDVIDGIEHTGTLTLTASASTPVEFFPTNFNDNFGLPFDGTLRDSLEYVSANLDTDQPMSVLASLPGTPLSVTGVVTLDESLPAITNAVLLDGKLAPVEPGDPTVSIGGVLGIDGSAIAPATGSHGLTLAAGSSGSWIRNAAIHGFATGTGVRVESSNNLLEALFLGQDRDGGTAPVTANNIGIDLAGAAAARNVIGVEAVGVHAGNVIVNSAETGILVRAGADYTSIFGNFIGTDRANATLGNGGDGITIEDTIGTLVGGVDTVLGNVVANNGENGILVQDVSASILPYGARILGNTVRDNVLAGVRILGGRNNVIGGAQIGAGNRIEGNEHGIVLSDSLISVTHGNLIEGNVVAGNAVDGLLVEYSWNNTINGNEFDGNGAAGIRLHRTEALNTVNSLRPSNIVTRNLVTGNGATPMTGGIVLEFATGQVIGGDSANGLGNEVLGNGGSGIVILGGQGANASRLNTIRGNFLGSLANGTVVAPNGGDGIRVQGSITNVITENTVAASIGSGIAVVNAMSTSLLRGNVVKMNSVTGSDAGIRVTGGSRHQIGSTVATEGNAVFGNRSDGIVVERSSGTGPAVGVVIRNNQIGLDTNNGAAGNTRHGIRITDSTATVVDYNNVVSHNAAGGILVQGGSDTTIGSAQTSRYENRFYRTVNLGTPFRANTVTLNGGNGVTVENPANLLAPTAITTRVNVVGNIIEQNVGEGVVVAGDRVSGITIGRRPTVGRPDRDGNQIRSNQAGGVTIDAAQAITLIGNEIIGNGPSGTPQIQLANGANGGIQAPTVTSAAIRSSGQRMPQYDVRGTVAGTPRQRFYVDLYGNRASDSRQMYLGRVLVTIGSSGTGTFRYLTAADRNSTGGVDTITATATLATTLFGGTSAFSLPVTPQ